MRFSKNKEFQIFFTHLKHKMLQGAWGRNRNTNDMTKVKTKFWGIFLPNKMWMFMFSTQLVCKNDFLFLCFWAESEKPVTCCLFLQCQAEARPVYPCQKKLQLACWSTGCLQMLTSSSTGFLTHHWPELRPRMELWVGSKRSGFFGPCSKESQITVGQREIPNPPACVGSLKNYVVVYRCWSPVVISRWCWSHCSQIHVIAS